MIATNNRIDDYQKGGNRASGVVARVRHDLGQHRSRGAGSTATIGQNGIFVSDDTTATISNNTISGNAYSPGALATGIAIVGRNDVVVSGNKLDANDYGVETFLAQGAIVHGNTVTDGAYGIAVVNSTNTVVDNNSTADQDNAGLYAEDDPSGSQSNGNRFMNNTATGVTGDGDFDCLDITTGQRDRGHGEHAGTSNAGDTGSPGHHLLGDSDHHRRATGDRAARRAGAGRPFRPGPPARRSGNEIIDKMRGNKLQHLRARGAGSSGRSAYSIARGVAHAPAKGTGRLDRSDPRSSRRAGRCSSRRTSAG